MRKSYLLMLLIAVAALGSVSFTADDPLYKNLKVLPKNITKPQLDSVMRHFNNALGVKCNFCHVKIEGSDKLDFASDANEHKGVARYMMKMTAKLNKKYFEVSKPNDLSAKLHVTCYTCHNGKAEPGTIPPKAEAPNQGPPPRPGSGASQP